MAYDCRGITITTQSPVALGALEKAVTSFLAHSSDLAEQLSAVLAADPDLVAAQCLAGFSHMLLGRAELFPLARCAHECARTALLARGGTARERALADALGAWVNDGAMDKSAAILDAALTAEPCDAMGAKLVQSVGFMLGDAAGMRRSITAALGAWTPDMPGYGFMLGCQAFALEETGALAEAEMLGREALAREPGDVWGCHAVAHIYETRGEPAHGLAWLMLHEPRWDAVNNFARHMFWHRALFHLARNEADIALGLYDTKIRGTKTDDYRDIANAASLLRLEARGLRVGARWRELADIAERHGRDHALAFAQLHYLLCLIGDGRIDAAYRFFAAMDIEARCGHGTQAELLGEVGVDLAKLMLGGSQASAGSPSLRNEIARLGGSNAQRQIFQRIVDRATRREPHAA